MLEMRRPWIFIIVIIKVFEIRIIGSRQIAWGNEFKDMALCFERLIWNTNSVGVWGNLAKQTK